MNINLVAQDIPLQTFIAWGDIENKKILEDLKSDALKQIANSDGKLNYKTNVKGKMTDWQSLANSPSLKNFIYSIKDEIKLIHTKSFILKEAWANLLKKDDKVRGHNHRGSIGAFCGIIYLSDQGPGTFFKELNFLLPEKTGRYVLFHPLLFHEVKKIENDIERLTIAFNCHEVLEWEKVEGTDIYEL